MPISARPVDTGPPAYLEGIPRESLRKAPGYHVATAYCARVDADIVVVAVIVNTVVWRAIKMGEARAKEYGV
jgi:hypothetical protein